ncbi:MAG: hypothetical protein KAS17_02955 [Victivallaceae bacterium]|nr:hypothetical protein [Victivallaceae bacterium]
MKNQELSSGGRAIIMETLREYKETKTLMTSDYEAIVEAISNIPAGIVMCTLGKEKQITRSESESAIGQTEAFGME